MQRPRRTSEFHEEPGTATKRQSRIASSRFTTSVGVTPVAAPSRYSSRQTASASGSAGPRGRAGPTPQKTPLRSGGPQRTLFSAEKKRNVAGIALHNDKKWILDQTQRITEYLKNAYYPGAITNINEDFFSRANCLKQMSIKQFVGIINYFLQFIVGNRLTVGTNYVEDIVNILQKINYPYPLNKSWLKTPNTTHSFGNVMVLFDFFMDFVSTPDDEFELDNLKPDDPSPDLEFKTILLQNCQQSFQLWDKQLNDEFEMIKRKTADLLIQKRHNLDGVDDVKAEIGSLLAGYNKLYNEQPLIDPLAENHCQQLRKRVKTARTELEQLMELDRKLRDQVDIMIQNKTALCAEVTQLEHKISELQLAIKQQQCNVKDRDACLEKVKYLRLELESKQRALRDLQNRQHNKKVELSSGQKKVTDQIENVNCLLRNLLDILDIADDKQQFHISMEANTEKIERLGPLLQQFSCKMKQKLRKAKEQLQTYEKEIEGNNLLKFSKLEPEFQAKQNALLKAQEALETFELLAIEESKNLFAKKQELDDQHNACKSENEYLKNQLEQKRQELQHLEQRNEETLSKAEEEHEAAVIARRKRLQTLKSYFNEYIRELESANRITKDIAQAGLEKS